MVGGEADLHVFSSHEAALACARATETEGAVLFRKSFDVPGAPEKVYVVITGDRGFVGDWAGAYVTREPAEKLAKKKKVSDRNGIEWDAEELVVEATYQAEAQG